ncbi:MAG: N-acetylmuramoyl-L-alanine amidase [Acidobacteriia bacterium]|nr:N-acetylmuramoyl-L-alanine amidase [Terriglobia bacterium]
MTTWIGCPDSNFHKGRPFGLRPEAVVVHIIDGSFVAGESVFRDPTTHKSAHYAISRSGESHQFVDEKDTAFHAGIVVNPTWALLKPGVNPNFYTIGIEHEGRPDDVWPEAQLSASATLIGQIGARWGIPLDDSHVIRHRQIRASKTCPGNWLQISELLQRVPTTLAPSAATAASPSAASPVAASGALPPASPVNAVSPITTQAPAGPGASTIIVVRTLKNVNLRLGAPNKEAQIVAVIPAQSVLVVSRFDIGERVDGNAYWYADRNGNYLWAGATDAPDPTVLAA